MLQAPHCLQEENLESAIVTACASPLEEIRSNAKLTNDHIRTLDELGGLCHRGRDLFQDIKAVSELSNIECVCVRVCVCACVCVRACVCAMECNFSSIFISYFVIHLINLFLCFPSTSPSGSHTHPPSLSLLLDLTLPPSLSSWTSHTPSLSLLLDLTHTLPLSPPGPHTLPPSLSSWTSHIPSLSLCSFPQSVMINYSALFFINPILGGW